MDVKQLESVIACAVSPDAHHDERLKAAQFLELLKLEPNVWEIGLQLFHQSDGQVSQFFGLTLVRTFLCSSVVQVTVRQRIRESIISWVTLMLPQSSIVPICIWNNLVSVMTLCLKHDYPELWPTAFTDILALGSLNVAALDLVVKILMELDIEVVMFTETRTKDEVAHNVIIKDTMRSSSAVRDILLFLCQSAQNVVELRPELSESCLRCLAHYVGWVDINLVVTLALPAIYQAVRLDSLRGAACACLLEIAKKGMDPLLKVELLESTQMLGCLSLVALPQTRDDDTHLDEFGAVVDMIALELLGCWAKFEESLVKSSGKTQSGEGATSQASLALAAPTVAAMLQSCLQMALAIYAHPDTDVCCTVLPCLTKLSATLKFQQTNRVLLQSMSVPGYFWAFDCLHQLLTLTYKQIQFAEEFNFDFDNDDDSEEIEAKKDIRKLFVNLCRVHPETCLELISMVLVSLPQPLSQAPFASLEAAMRLVHLFSEGCNVNHKLVTEGNFPALVRALHQTDAVNHSHSQVLLIFYELSVRYVKLLDNEAVLKCAAYLTSNRGIRHSDAQVRQRSAYFLYKLAEAMEGKSAILLGSSLDSFSDLILMSPGVQSSMLTAASELHLLEAVGLMTSSVHVQVTSADIAATQLMVLTNMTIMLSRQLQELLSSPQFERYFDDMSDAVAHKVASLTCLARGHSHKTRPEVMPIFEIVGSGVLQAISFVCAAQRAVRSSTANVRNKCAIFMHRMIICLGQNSLTLMRTAAPLLIAAAQCPSELDETAQLLNQAMLEFEGQAAPVVDLCFEIVLQRHQQFVEELERSVSQGHCESTAEELDRICLQRVMLLFLQHIATTHCEVVLISPQHSRFLNSIFSALITGLQGGNHPRINSTMGLPLRKLSLCSLVGLVKTMLSEACVRDISTVAFRSFLTDHAIPLSIRICCDGQSINLRDAATQGLLQEVGSLIWSICATTGQAAAGVYFHQELTSQGWSQEAQAAFMQLLNTNVPLGTFRDHFKQLIRNLAK